MQDMPALDGLARIPALFIRKWDHGFFLASFSLRWSFLLTPGWRELRSSPLEEICAHQYIACNEAVLDARSRIDFAQWLDASYEDLISDPVATARWLFENLALDFTPEVRAFAENLTDRPGSTALTPPQPHKWRHQNPSEIERILPLVARTERRLGW